MNDRDYELASRMIGAFEDFVSGHRVERIRLAADILALERPFQREELSRVTDEQK